MPSIDCLSLIDKGICQADCCGYVPIPVTTSNQYRHLAAVQPVEVLRNDDIVMVDTGKSDIKCVFLDRQTLRCNIYHLVEDVPEGSSGSINWEAVERCKKMLER